MRMAHLLDDLPPMLLDERPFVFGESGWLYEIKFDGYRLMAGFGDGECMLRTRVMAPTPPSGFLRSLRVWLASRAGRSSPMARYASSTRWAAATSIGFGSRPPPTLV